MLIVSGPLKNSGLWLAGEQKTLPCSIKVFVQLDGAGDECTEDVILGILDTEQGGVAGLHALPVQGGKAEPMSGGGEY